MLSLLHSFLWIILHIHAIFIVLNYTAILLSRNELIRLVFLDSARGAHTHTHTHVLGVCLSVCSCIVHMCAWITKPGRHVKNTCAFRPWYFKSEDSSAGPTNPSNTEQQWVYWISALTVASAHWQRGRYRGVYYQLYTVYAGYILYVLQVICLCPYYQLYNTYSWYIIIVCTVRTLHL